MSLTHWESEKLYFDSDDFYQDLINEMNQANQSIDMEVFTFEEGLLAQRLLEVFKNAIARGVVIRIIADGWGSPKFWETIGPKLDKIGVKIRIYRSLPWRHPRHSKGEPRSKFFKFFFRFKRINRGFHRKSTLIDKKIAWVGSLNVTDVHLKEVYGKNAWADIGVRLSGPPTKILAQAFNRAFLKRRWLRFPHSPQSKLILLNDSFLRRRRTTFIQKRRIKRAQNCVWIQTPYFVPERSLLRALYHSARRNIDIKIITPEKNDQPLVKILSYALFAQIIKHGIKLYEYQPRFSHKKVLIADQIHTVGSTNFNHRSFLHDLELEVLLMSEESKSLLKSSFLDDLKDSIEITEDWIIKKPLWYRILARILFFFRFWC